MDSNILFAELKQVTERLFKAHEYYIEPCEIEIPSGLTHNLKIELDKDSIYYLTSKQLDIPTTTSLFLSSENNFISTSKEDWEFENEYRMEEFRNYLHVRSLNSAVAFEFKLKFLKVTPYRNN